MAQQARLAVGEGEIEEVLDEKQGRKITVPLVTTENIAPENYKNIIRIDLK